MASKLSSKKPAQAPRPVKPAPGAAHRERRNERRGQQTVDRFRTSCKGFRCVFSGHFPEKLAHVETLAFHLAQFEATLPSAVEAIRLARYPGAGNRNPKRMALGLCENLSLLETHLASSIRALEALANGKKQ
jgi:hypothetical protein